MEFSAKEKFALISIAILVFLAIVLRVYQSFQNSQKNGELVVIKPVATSTLATETPIVENVIASTTDLGIIIDQPRPNESFTSPFAVAGKARGPWFFENSFPLKIIDEQAKVLGTGVATAQISALTNDFVPFVGFIEFLPNEKPASSTKAFLVFTNDNPSGLPENEISTTVPIIIN